jgi:hypothetical protein
MQRIFIDYASGHDGDAATRIGEMAAAAMPAGCPAETRGILLRGEQIIAKCCFGFFADGCSDLRQASQEFRGGSDFTYTSQRNSGGTSGVIEKNHFSLNPSTLRMAMVAYLIGCHYNADGIE